MSRVIVAHSPPAPSRASFACQVPATGFATSANQKYGGPPCRSPDLAATLPSGAVSENSPANGFSAAMTERGYQKRHSDVIWWLDIELCRHPGDFSSGTNDHEPDDQEP